MKLELGMGNGAKKPVKYPTKRSVNLAKRESHSPKASDAFRRHGGHYRACGARREIRRT